MRMIASLLALTGLTLAGTAAAQLAPTAEQQQALQARWQQADANGDGVLDPSEAKAIPALSKHFAELDADHNGVLSMTEIGHLVQDRLQQADTNHDGYIDRAEAQASLPRVARFFDRLDANGDGKLSPEEAQQAAARAQGRFGGAR